MTSGKTLRRESKKIQLNFSITLTQRVFYSIIALGVLLFVALGAGIYVYAYNSGGPASVVGHSSEEVDVNIGGTIKTLQQAIDNGDFSSSVWTQSGNNIYYNNGNVGVGTSSPTEKLEVAGNIKASGTVCDANGCLSRNSCAWTGWSSCEAAGASNQMVCSSGQVVRGYQRQGCSVSDCTDPTRCEQIRLYCCG